MNQNVFDEENGSLMNVNQLETAKESNRALTPIILNILREVGEEELQELVLDYFFYANTREDAESLSQELFKMGYCSEIHEGNSIDNRFSINGQTLPMRNDEAVIVQWANRMAELAFIHNCDFDGWGTMNCEMSMSD